MKQKEIAATLRANGIDNADWEAKLLCEAFTNEALLRAVAKRCEHYPLQYILGNWAFYREVYEVNSHCLIPRSDTEILVDEAVKRLPNGARFLDLCTGSGCVAISTLATRHDTSATAVDLFPETLDLAARNATKNMVDARLTFLLADVLQAPPGALSCERFDAILSNPPYIKNEVVPTLQKEVSFEPAAALCGGEDGLDFYRAILEKWSCLLTSSGFILFEIGYDQSAAIAHLAAKYRFSCTLKRDFGGNDRIAILTKI